MRRSGHSGGRVVAVAIVSTIAGLVVVSPPVVAQDASETAIQPKYGWREIYGGIDAARDQWFAYSGMTIAPFSPDIYSNGWRLRFGGGYGRYSYDTIGPHTNCGVAVSNDICTEQNRTRQHFDVSHSYAEALLGYYLQLGQLTAKAFAGASMSSEHHVDGVDPSHDNDGTEFGVKGALELWLTINDTAWSSLDLSYSTARNETASRWRTGWHVMPSLSIGPELRYDKNIETGDGAWNGRAGLFARYEWTGGEVSAAGGAAWWIDGWTPNDPSAYGTVNVMFRY
ncbi:MAG: cellulose biosynthesis protein BcsS [Hyphomicrobium sp.]|uniref:cellulose biosynthesis protein BcsS n=1 Tax=Hyphomicrobium sp. TaxID=82 RepID=UPI0039E62186